MALNDTYCETKRCVSCNCSCEKPGGHTCESCKVCLPTDDHTRKRK